MPRTELDSCKPHSSANRPVGYSCREVVVALDAGRAVSQPVNKRYLVMPRVLARVWEVHSRDFIASHFLSALPPRFVNKTRFRPTRPFSLAEEPRSDCDVRRLFRILFSSSRAARRDPRAELAAVVICACRSKKAVVFHTDRGCCGNCWRNLSLIHTLKLKHRDIEIGHVR